MNRITILTIVSVISFFSFIYPQQSRQDSVVSVTDSVQMNQRDSTRSVVVPEISSEPDTDEMKKLFLSPLAMTLITAIATLISAFVGAWSAFKLQDNSNSRATTDSQVSAVNRAIFTLTQQWNILNNIYKQIIEPVEDNALAFINMRALMPSTTQMPVIDFNELSFILETKHRQLLADIYLEQERFESAIHAMNYRAKIHLDSVQPKMAESGIRVGDAFTAEQLEKMLGHGMFETLKVATGQAVAHNKKTRASLLKVMTALNGAMKEQFPKKSIILFAPKEEAV